MLHKIKKITEKIPSRLHPRGKQKRIILLAGMLAIAALAFLLFKTNHSNHVLTVSGTIETTQVHLGSEFGGRVESVFVDEGESIQNEQILVSIHRSSGSSEKVRSPLNGVVLERSIEPGEIASPGSTLLVLANLQDLTLTVYVPEDRYGRIFLGQSCDVNVDSYPGQTFQATVSHISDQAEFTPRNVQTSDSRKSTVFAVRLKMEPSGNRLKPGMPADLTCRIDHD